MPLLALDEVVERIDAVTLDDLAALADELWAPERLSAAGIGPDAERFDEALRRGARGRSRSPEARRMIRVAVAGAAGRMGATVCDAVEGAEDMELVGRADPALGTTLADVLRERPTCSSTSRTPTTALANAPRGGAPPACTS